MYLFQYTVLREFVQQQNQASMAQAFAIFEQHFANPQMQNNIRQAKEEQYQEGFLNDLFVKVLGYTLYPNPEYNLITEQKMVNTARKADAAILKHEQIRAVLELKSTKVFDLNNIEPQAFSYKNAQKNCPYVITANFQKLRLYIENTLDYQEFDLFNLDFEQFKVLYTLLHAQNLLQDLPLLIKEKSIQKEEEITLEFYNEYQSFKELLFVNIYHFNKTKHDELTLFALTQKILDRIIFICFAQDKGLLPPNLIQTIIAEWENGQEEGREETFFDRLKAHFRFIDKGFKSKKYDIFGYNGGLFAKDQALENLQISDNILVQGCTNLSRKNFDTQINVNILGHIFEYSLSQFEAKRQEIIAQAQQQSPEIKANYAPILRKADGIFYTPPYITRYIIEETLGKACENKRKELQLDYTAIDFDQPQTKDFLLTQLQQYQTWLQELTILDPACGSGAFLNEVLNFLIKQYTWVETQMKALTNTEKTETAKTATKHRSIFDKIQEEEQENKLSEDITHQILEKNIFGVDINQESVGITKLSLWLRIAQGKKRLNDLSRNIKQGNSLIEDKNIDERAFDWQREFPQVMKKGGFKFIVGNPPYVSIKLIREEYKAHFLEKYKTAQRQFDLYGLFIERGLSLLHKGGCLSYITSSTFLSNKDFMKLRRFLFENTKILQLTYLGETVFEQAAVDVVVFMLENQTADKEHKIKVIRNRQDFDAEESPVHEVRQSRFDVEKNNYEIKLNAQESDFDLIDKIYHQKDLLGNILELPRGIEIGGSDKKISNKPQKNYQKLLVGKNISRYCLHFSDMYIQFENDKSVFKTLDIYQRPKILIQRIRNLTLKQRIIATLDTENYLCTNTLRIGFLKNNQYNLYFILAILNAKITNFIFSKFFLNKDIYAHQLERIPVPIISLKEQESIQSKVQMLLANYKQLYATQSHVLAVIEANYGLPKTSRKLEQWYKLDKKSFLEELQKQKINIPLSKQKELFAFFEAEKQTALSLYEEIQTLENQLDTMIYALYNLTEQEIALIENNA